MLTLSRKVGETIVIGSNIFITVTRMERDKVRIAIDAPRDIPVWRKEVYDRMQQEGA